MSVYEGQSKVKDIELSSMVGVKSESALYQVVVARLSHEREGNAFTMTKSEVRGGGKKPWRQKGLGRARAGSTRSPLWRGGGVIFGPKPRDFSKTINRKQKNMAFVSVFTNLLESGKLKVFSDFEFKGNKTKEFLKAYDSYINNKDGKIVIIVPDYNKGLVLASRNIQNIKVMFLGNLDIYPLVYADEILISEKAALELDSRLAK